MQRSTSTLALLMFQTAVSLSEQPKAVVSRQYTLSDSISQKIRTALLVRAGTPQPLLPRSEGAPPKATVQNKKFKPFVPTTRP